MKKQIDFSFFSYLIIFYTLFLLVPPLTRADFGGANEYS